MVILVVVDHDLLLLLDEVEWLLAVGFQGSERVERLPIERVHGLEELPSRWVWLILLAEEVVRAVLEKLPVRALLKLGFDLEVLCGDAAHVGGLLDLVLVNDLLNIHLEALARAKHVAIFDKNDYVARINPIFRLAARMFRFLRDLLHWAQVSRHGGTWLDLHAELFVFHVLGPEAKSVLLDLVVEASFLFIDNLVLQSLQDVQAVVFEGFEVIMAGVVAQSGMSRAQTHLHVLVARDGQSPLSLRVVKSGGLSLNNLLYLTLQCRLVQRSRQRWRKGALVSEVSRNYHSAEVLISRLLDSFYVGDEDSIILLNQAVSEHFVGLLLVELVRSAASLLNKLLNPVNGRLSLD